MSRLLSPAESDLTPEAGPEAELVSRSMGPGKCDAHHANPGGFELESAGAVYRYRDWRFGCGIHEERKRLIPSVIDVFLWSLGDSNLLRHAPISRLSIGWSIVVGESAGATFRSCLQSLGSSAGLQDAILLSFRRTRPRRFPSIY